MNLPPINYIDQALFLKNTELFSPLDMDILLNIAQRSSFQNYKKGQLIYDALQEATRVFLVYEGKVTLASSLKQEQITHEKYQHFGDTPLLSDTKRTWRATALEPCKLLTLTKADFLRILSEFTPVALKLLSEYAKQLD